MHNFLRDIRLAARVLLKTPVVTGIAILALALGIGVNASSLVSVSAFVLHPLPYPRLDRIVTIGETLTNVPAQRGPLSAADFLDLKAGSSSFAQLAAYREWDAALTGRGNPERVLAARVTPSFFHVLGLAAVRGRTFANDGDHLADSVAVVSEAFCQSHLGGATSAVGKSISLEGEHYTVIGVMPSEFNYPLENEIWVPLKLTAAERRDRSQHDLMVLGLLKPNVTAATASVESGVIASRLAQLYPATNQSRSMTVLPLSDMSDRVTRQFALFLFGATLFVLLLACANVSNLQLARAAKRQKEIALRAALGATRLQIARQLFAETLLISLTAGIIGLFLASWAVGIQKSELPAMVFRILPGAANMGVNPTVVMLTLAVSIAAGVLCSLPAVFQLVIRRMRTDLRNALQERGAGSAALPAQNRSRSVLVVFQLALALVLLVGAGLMVKTFQRLLDRYQGFDPRNVLTMEVSLPGTEYRTPAQIGAFYDRALQRLATNPGITEAAISSSLAVAERFGMESLPVPRPGEPRPDVMAVSGEYLAAMRIPLLGGRFLSNQDRASTPGVVVVSKSIARHYWPHSSPIGKRIRLGRSAGWLTIVGVCGDVIDDWFGGEPSPTVYVPYSQHPNRSGRILLRTSGHPLQVAPGARAAIRSIDKNLPVYNVETMEKDMADERSGIHAAATAMAEYAFIALLLSVTGVYGVLSYFVTARTREIGIRMALGASPRAILRMTVVKTVGLTALGLGIGVPLAVLLSYAMSRVLYGVVHADARVVALFAVILALSALLAGYLPSRRAARIDPISALRSE